MPRHHAAFDDVGFEVEVFDFCGNLGRALRNIAECHRTEAVLTSTSASQKALRPDPIAVTGPTPVTTAGVIDIPLV